MAFFVLNTKTSYYDISIVDVIKHAMFNIYMVLQCQNASNSASNYASSTSFSHFSMQKIGKKICLKYILAEV